MDVRQIDLVGDKLWDGDMRLDGEGKDGGIREKVYEMGIGFRRKDTKVFGKRRVTEKQTKGESGGFEERLEGGKGSEIARRCLGEVREK